MTDEEIVDFLCEAYGAGRIGDDSDAVRIYRQHIAEYYIPKERVRCDCGSTEWECYHCANPVNFPSEQAGSE